MKKYFLVGGILLFIAVLVVPVRQVSRGDLTLQECIVCRAELEKCLSERDKLYENGKIPDYSFSCPSCPPECYRELEEKVK